MTSSSGIRDGSDRVEGQEGHDTLRFNGANVADYVGMPGFASVVLSFFVTLCKPQAVLNQIILYNDFLQLILAALSVCSRLTPGGTARIRPVYPAHHPALLPSYQFCARFS